MKGNLGDDIWEERHINKHSLDIFNHERVNILDNPIDKLIESLKTKFNNAYSEYKRLEDLYNAAPSKFHELEEEANLTGQSIQMEMFSYFEDGQYLEEELFALFEMKIIYAFKHLEITIKQLLSSAYKDDSINRQYKWDSIIQFLSSKKIDSKDLNSYEEVIQLKNVNNSLKHSDKIIDQSLKNIKEFKDKSVMGFVELETFYNRIKKAPEIFLASLISHVFKDLYAFNEDRIQEIAKSFGLRMEKKDAFRLSEELLKLYK